MKKSFTLLELLISITLFSIIVVFLYKTIDQTKHSNNLFSNKEQALKESNHLHNIFLEDIAESSSITITSDKNKNSIIKIVTNNTYHNAFFNNITYLINSSKKLVRIESYQAFNELQPMTLDFEANSYMDILLEDIELFELKNSGVNYNFLLKQKNKDRSFFNTYKLGKNL
jgi:prepilin-type N-terminal cleavage/methylation domain-containing protein